MKRSIAGFTLVEMMIVVAVIAILASLAIPAYSRYVMQSRRAQALNAVQRVAALEEQFYFAHGAYTDNAGNQLGVITPTPDGGNYSITVVAPAGTPATFTITARPVANQLQARDTECATFTLTNTGVQGATGSTGDQTSCWKH